MKLFKKILILLPLLYSSACITTSFNEEHLKWGDIQLEFTNNFEGPYAIFHGTIKPIAIKNTPYYLMQFPDILAGENRYLAISVPVHSKGPVFFDETAKKIEGSKSAYLIYTSYCCLDTKLSNTLLFQKKGKNSDPTKILKKYFKDSQIQESYPFIIASLDCSNRRDFSFRYIVWKKEANVPRVDDEGLYIELRYDTDLAQIEWKKRSKAKYYLGYLVYPFSLIADIVTSPFQLIFFIYYSASGGGP